jgi:hypothetical protein
MIWLKGAVSDFAALLRVQRIRVLNDDRFYSNILAANAANPELAFVEIFPQNTNGTSGPGGAKPLPQRSFGCNNARSQPTACSCRSEHGKSQAAVIAGKFPRL